MRVVPNSGIMGDETLDRLRAEAIAAQHETPLPDAVVYYLQALERDYAATRAERRSKALREIGWKLAPPQDPRP